MNEENNSDETDVDIRLVEIKKELDELKVIVEGHAEEMANILSEFKAFENTLSIKMNRLYSIINVHTDTYSKLNIAVHELTKSNTEMKAFLSTLEAIRRMLDLSSHFANRASAELLDPLDPLSSHLSTKKKDVE